LTRVVISRCLGFEACRYNGVMIEAPWLRELASCVELVPVCPETEIGLGVPRKPINLVQLDNGIHVIQEETELDLTMELTRFSEGYLRFVGKVDAFILKSKSPSCGIGSAKILQGGSCTFGSGIFASLVEEMFPGVVMVDEHFMAEKGVKALLRLIEKNQHPY